MVTFDSQSSEFTGGGDKGSRLAVLVLRTLQAQRKFNATNYSGIPWNNKPCYVQICNNERFIAQKGTEKSTESLVERLKG